MKKIFLLDAVNYLFRSYYAIGPMLSPQGESTSALYGFIRSLQKLTKDFSPDYIVAIFDGPDNKKSRQRFFADYKMHRKQAPEDLYPQFEWASRYCQLAGIPFLCIEGIEADDAMASVALWAKKQGFTVFLCTSDKDLMQIIDDQIFMLQLHKNNLLVDTKKVKEIHGVEPTQMLDLLAIMGDSSDNIPGLPGFGPKTAASLLQEFGSLDAILAKPEKVKGQKKQQTLKEEKDTALLSRKLATLDTEVAIPKELAFYEADPPDTKGLFLFFEKMGFRSLLRELEDGAPKRHKKAEIPYTKRDYHLVDSMDKLKTLVEHLLEQKQVCIDTETSDLDPFLAHLVGIGLGFLPGESWYIPMNGSLKKKEVLSALNALFKTKKPSFFGHNLKYDYHVLFQHGIEIQSICFDTLLASYIADPQKKRHGLDDVSLEKLQRKKIPFASLVGKGKKAAPLSEAPLEKVAEYCGEDVDYTIRLKDIFSSELEEKNLFSLLEDIELPLLIVLAKMEREGIFLDVQELKKVGSHLVGEIAKIKEKIFSLADTQINLNSPKQLAELLYQKLKIPSRTKSTSADVLESLLDLHPIIPYILQYRTLEKLRSTYVDALPLSVNPITDRVHCSFQQSVAATGRLSCQNPNLQNIPRNSKIRSCFKAKKGFSLLGADYSQIELRLLAHFSEDPRMIETFLKKGDIHTHTASLIFEVKESEVTSEMRRKAKTVNFGILYGQTPFGLAKQLSISKSQAALFIETYFKRYPKIKNYLESSVEDVEKFGYSTTLFGRKRPIPEIKNKNPQIRHLAQRLAINSPLQGTAADLIKKAMIAIDREIVKEKLEGKMILQIHDELIFEIPDHEIDIFKSLVKKHMETIASLKIPLEVDIAIGKNWAEC